MEREGRDAWQRMLEKVFCFGEIEGEVAAASMISSFTHSIEMIAEFSDKGAALSGSAEHVGVLLRRLRMSTAGIRRIRSYG